MNPLLPWWRDMLAVIARWAAQRLDPYTMDVGEMMFVDVDEDD